MFFSISSTPDSQFPNIHNHGFAFFNCDNGWTQYNTKSGVVYAKGYANNVPLESLVEQFDQAGQHTGNFCLVKFHDTVTIQHSKTRTFPLRYNSKQVTNLYPGTDVWADGLVVVQPDWSIAVKTCPLDLALSSEYTTINCAETKIVDLLTQHTQQFLNYNRQKVKLYVTGGLDTLLLYALLSTSGHDFILLPFESHCDPDLFRQRNQELLKQFWAYKQINFWTQPTMLATGSCGDEYLLRGPTVIAMLTSWHNINFAEILSANPDAYHYHYFKKYSNHWNESWNNRTQLQEQFPTRELLNQHILNILVNDHQHWHLGNTLTWTPFNDIELAKILLSCDINELIPQFIDGRISKNIISKLDNRLLSTLSQYKNYNSQENLHKLLDYHKKIQ